MIKASALKRFAGRSAPWLTSSRSTSRTSVFLSHSHRDVELVQAVRRLLGSLGIAVYVDWMDPGMPSTTSSATAERVRQKIIDNHKFLMLVTSNSLQSRWVPWELGLADGLKGVSNMAVLEVRSNDGDYQGNEYIDLYPKVDEVAGEFRWVPGTYESRGKSRQSVAAWLR